MKHYERSALVLVGILVTTVVSATLSRPPVQVPTAPKAILHLNAALQDYSVQMDVPMAAASVVPEVETLAGTLSKSKAKKAYDSLRSHGYQLEQVLAGDGAVPRLFLASLPHDMASLPEVKVRKDLFIKTVLPLVLQVNDEILADRQRLWSIRHAALMDLHVRAEDRLWLRVKTEQYGLEDDDMEGLLNRMDVIPPSLAVAQAAEESGWGTSRFVREGNALFGQYAFSEDGVLIPIRRDQDKSHAIKSFATLADSVRAYALNLNTHLAYARFRENRSKLRQKGQPLNGYALALTLGRYSARGEEYTKVLRTIISTNDLTQVDDVRLRPQDSIEHPAI